MDNGHTGDCRALGKPYVIDNLLFLVQSTFDRRTCTYIHTVYLRLQSGSSVSLNVLQFPMTPLAHGPL
jgi:hypothetical protein